MDTGHETFILDRLITGSPAPLGYFERAFGPAATPTLHLNWVFTAISVAVCLIIASLLIVGLLRNKSTGMQVEPGGTAAIRWIALGSIISTIILFGMATYALIALNSVAGPALPAQVTISVTGYDWWWRAHYGDFETANEIHIPVGQPVRVKLYSADVIHAFWVPKLAGKTQMIPGVVTTQWFQADKPGIYRGQCTQFCGLQHAHMAFEVVADAPADFARWRQAQAKPARQPATDIALRGQAIFMDRCAACHTVRGMEAAGGHAPDLTHLMSRREIAAGQMANTPENLMMWVQHTQDIKPGARMPQFALTKPDEAALSAYLTELR